MQPFDPIQSPLRGKCLIEAGAGTGKTYTITTLVLRLILEAALPVETILVVTFTTAATAELRDRVRSRLKTAQAVLRGAPCEDSQLIRLLASCAPRQLAIERLEDALANFDRMPVFTIHGFCQRILIEMAFETGSAFDAELITDTTPLVQRLADDFWRKTWTASPPELMRFALPQMKSPDHLAILYQRYAVPLMDIQPDAPYPSPPSMEAFRTQWSQIRAQWRAFRDDLLTLLTSPDLKANIYGSLTASTGNGAYRTRREEKIKTWALAMDQWTRSTTGAFPPPEALDYFTRSKLARSVKKGAQAPRHSFFEECDGIWEEAQRLSEGLQTWLVGTFVRFFHFMAEGLSQAKQEQQVLFFDDLLLQVHEALQQKNDPALKRMLQLRYRAVLIDEFQDTDAIQYAIFDALFGGGEHLMAMIGDPKQAIYSFRGADIFTYLHAAQEAAQRFTLTRNWRATTGMVAALNSLFSHCPRPFLWPEITYHRAVAAKREGPIQTKQDRSSSLTVWYLDNPALTARRRAFNKQTAGDRILAALAGEVHRLATCSASEKGLVAFQDMAVLVRTNRQAQDVKRCLGDAGIPAVIYNAGSVFHQPEALDFRRLLSAVADPSGESRLRTVLTTPLFGFRGKDLAFEDAVPQWWSEMVDRFFGYRDLWHRDGFIRMFRQLAVREKIAARLLAGPGGERYLTNLLHLAELLHRASIERALGIAELLQWLDDRRMQEYDAADAHQMRLESDDQAVTVMTVHKSKGLEFPVVFCPFTWEGGMSPRPPALCHQKGRYGYRLLDLGSDDLDHHLAQMAEEQLAEEIRLLYVAVTRAKERCYVVWGPLPSSENAALAYLLYGDGEMASGETYQGMRRKIAALFREADDLAFRAPIEALVREADGAVAMIALPEPPLRTLPAPPAPESFLDAQARRYARGPQPAWKIASFSSLISRRRDDGELREESPEKEDPYVEDLNVALNKDASREIGEIARFEAGPRAGTFLHEILERIDFTATASKDWLTVIEERMQAYSFDDQWKTAISGMLERVVNARLEEGIGKAFALRQISKKKRLNELEFHLPLRAIDAVSLERAFKQCRQTVFQGKLAGLLEQLAFSLSGGYLKGFIDLVFRHEGRYFIADWKSNLLGESFDAYRPRRLADVMVTHYYFLQYHIYVLALERYLRSCLPDYHYTKHFGGVFYFFIRGMGAPDETSTGVFYDCPDWEFVQHLEKRLIV
jgi:exodeoxyribonuclease V beta subunit